MIRLRARELLWCVAMGSLSIAGAPVCADEPETLGLVTLQSSTEITGDGAGLAVNPGDTIDLEMRAGAAINQVPMGWNRFPTLAALGPFCGDGVVSGDETCDDGNDIDDDNCRNDC